MNELYAGMIQLGSRSIATHQSKAPIDVVPEGAPEMGTPEFREFVKTAEWVELRHEQALRDDELWKIDPKLVSRRKYFSNDDEPRSPHFAPRRLGATALCDPMHFCSDIRERLPVDHPSRMDYEEGIYGKSEAELAKEDLDKITMLHKAALLLTKPVY